MKNIFPFLLLIVLLISCKTTYYYSKLNTDDEHVFKTKEGDFVTENDSLYIIYSFFGENAPINIGVYNKSEQALYIDWSQSALIIDGVSYGYDINYDETPNGWVFIAPQTQVSYTSYRLANFPFDAIPNNRYDKAFMHRGADKVSVKKAEFTERDSPLRLRSYVTIFDDNPSRESARKMVFDQSFYLSSLMKTGGSVVPEDVSDFLTQQGDFFYVKHQKESNFGTVMGVIGVGVAVIAIGVLLPEEEYY